MSHLDTFDLLYRSLCALLFNYVPMSGHPGGSVSSGRFVAGMAAGRFDVTPTHDCPTHCPFRQICEHSPARARRKGAGEEAEP